MESTTITISASDACAILDDWSKNRLTVYLLVVTGLPGAFITQRKGNIEKLPSSGFQHMAGETISMVFPENFGVISRVENSEFVGLQFKQRESGDDFMLHLFVTKTNETSLDELPILNNIIH